MGLPHRPAAPRRCRPEDHVGSTCVLAPMTISLARDLLSSPSPGGGGSTAERSEGRRGGVSFRYLAQEFTPPRLTSRYARCFADPPPPGEGEACALIGRTIARSHLVLRLQRQADRLAGCHRAFDGDGRFQVDAGLLGRGVNGRRPGRQVIEPGARLVAE